MSDNNGWIAVADELPPNGEIVETKVDDKDGARNVQTLRLRGGLWWLPDDTLYVYYVPTHWRESDNKLIRDKE